MVVRRTYGRRAPAHGRGMSRRDFLKYSGAGVASVSLLPACGGFGGGDDGGGGSNTITFSHGPDDSGSIQALLDEFNKSNGDGLTVVWREQPADTGAYFDKLRTEFQAGGGDIDVISGDVIWPAQFAANGWIDPLSDRLSDDLESQIVDGALQANIYEDEIYGVPWFTDAGMLYYRKDLISEAPTSWDDLKQMAADIAKKEGVKFGFVLQGAQYEGGVCNGCEFVWTHGGNILDPEDPTTVLVGEQEAIAGLETERSTVTDGVAPDDVVNYMEQQTHESFLAGDAVFARNWPYMFGLAADPAISKIKPEQIGVAPLPTGSGGDLAATLGGWNLFINANSDNKENGWKLIEFLAGTESQKKKSLKGAFLPTLKPLYDDTEITDNIPVIPLAREVFDNIRPRPVSPFYSDISLVMQQGFNDSLGGDVEPSEAAATMQSDIEEINAQGA